MSAITDLRVLRMSATTDPIIKIIILIIIFNLSV